eukprot:scaffold11705_cov636-Chaetoceros_neogracile.AAC.1
MSGVFPLKVDAAVLALAFAGFLPLSSLPCLPLPLPYPLPLPLPRPPRPLSPLPGAMPGAASAGRTSAGAWFAITSYFSNVVRSSPSGEVMRTLSPTLTVVSVTGTCSEKRRARSAA